MRKVRWSLPSPITTPTAAGDTVELFDLGDRTCILSINGNRQWTTRLAYVQHLQSNIEKLINGEAPVLDY